MNDNPFVTRFTTPEAAQVSGPLAHVTVAVKDLFRVAGHRTGNGNPTLQRHGLVADRHAAVVERLIAAGATVTGITRMDELALSLNGINPHDGAVYNPRYPGRITGGSSSGSAAAVANGDVDCALGSDTAGSLRLPASFCGLFTLRPTFGRIDTTGMLPLAPTFDTPGVFTREPDLLATIMRLLFAEPKPVTPIRRVVTPTDLLAICDPALAGAADTLARKLAAHGDVEHVAEPFGVALNDLKRSLLTLLGAEAYATHRDVLTRTPDILSEATRNILENGAMLDTARRDTARTIRQQVSERASELLTDTVIVLPAAPTLPLPVDAPVEVFHDMNARAVTLHALGSLAGVPCAVVPIDVNGDTAGMMLIGAQNSDETLLELLGEVN